MATTTVKQKASAAVTFKRTFESAVLTNDDTRCWGQTTFKGTRVLASTLFEYLSNGQTLDDFLEDFPMERSQAVALLREVQELLTP